MARFGKDIDPNVGKNTQFKPGIAPNPNGRPKGRKNLSTIIRDCLEDPNFDWKIVPIKKRGRAMEIGTPFKAIVITALAKAYSGDVKAMEWLRKAGYGDKVEYVDETEMDRFLEDVEGDIERDDASRVLNKLLKRYGQKLSRQYQTQK